MKPTPTFVLDEVAANFKFDHFCEGMEPTTAILPIGEGYWELVQEEPLTVMPSIHCRVCGTHGFITNGRWIEV